MPRNQCPAHNIAVPADEFRGRVHHHIDAEIERMLDHGSGECPVAYADGIGLARDARQRREITDI